MASVKDLSSGSLRALTELVFHAPTYGRLDDHVRAAERTLHVPCEVPLEPGDVVMVHLLLGELPHRATLDGTVSKWGPDERRERRSMAQVALSARSWERLRSLAMWLPWRRSADFDADLQGSRSLLDRPSSVLVGGSTDAIPATLIDASPTGAFLGTAAQMREGDVIWFQVEADAPNAPWHLATILWTGTKDDHHGVGVSLDFESPNAHEEWREVLESARDQPANKDKPRSSDHPKGAVAH